MENITIPIPANKLCTLYRRTKYKILLRKYKFINLHFTDEETHSKLQKYEILIIR